MNKLSETGYSEQEIIAKLAKQLPNWYYEAGWIRRRYRTGGWKATLMVINTVGFLAEKAWHHPDITASYGFVEVRLMTHSAKAVTELDFTLATLIEATIATPPPSPLTGTPDSLPHLTVVKNDR